MIRHSFESPIPDGTTPGMLQPSHWNADHAITYPLVLGSETDNTTVEPDGTLRMNGGATVFEDLIGTALQLKVAGGASISATENVLLFTTAADLQDYGYDNFQMRHAWKTGTPVFPHVHWEQAQDATPNWLLQYRWQRNGLAKTTGWTNYPLTRNAFAYTSGILNQITGGPGLVPPEGAGLSDIIELRILRDNDNDSGVFAGVDPYTATVGMTSIDIHLQLDTFGSRQEYVK